MLLALTLPCILLRVEGGCSDFWALLPLQQSLFALFLVPSPCFLSPCENGATCEDLGRGYSCTCPMGYVGKHCQSGKSLVVLCVGMPLWALLTHSPPHAYFSPEVDCGVPSEVKHAQASFNSTKVGSLAEYQCELGYSLSQHNHPRVCHLPGIWSDPPECDGELCWVAAEPWGTIPVWLGDPRTCTSVLPCPCLWIECHEDPCPVLMFLVLSLACLNAYRD